MNPTTESRVIRVFISSTFRDMQEERDYLIKFIFPQIRKLCESRGVVFSEVDLRWGITDEQSAEGQVLPICLAEIQRSRPYFIGLLGERYGWIPDAISPELIEREPWLAEHKDHSVTELEILHGVLNNPDMADHALFYFRDPNYINSLDKAVLSDYIEVPWREDIDKYGIEEAQRRVDSRKRKLQELKERIRKSGFPVREGYPNPHKLGELVLADLTAIIDQLYPAGSEPDPLQKKALLHDAFALSRARVYIGGDKYYQQLDRHVRESSLPLVVLGESGSGKSALLANWGIRYREAHPEELVLMHFIGATPASADWAAMLRRLMGELKQRFDIAEEIPEEADKLRSAFPNWLYMAAAKGKAVLILDALNQLEDRQGAQELTWLPMELPENIRLVLSTLPGKPLDAVKERGWPTLNVEPLDQAERERLIRVYLAQYTKQLSSNRVQRIATDPQSSNPLGLRVLLDELRQFGRHEDLDIFIDKYLGAESIPSMFSLTLERCEKDFESERPGLVGDAMRYIWAARRGLSVPELLDLLGSGGNPLPYRVWSPLSLALEQSLVDRGGLLNFFHDFIRQAVEERYLLTDEGKKSAHLRLADYFSRLEDNLPQKLEQQFIDIIRRIKNGSKAEDHSPRKVEELPWQLQQAGRWQWLYDLLADLTFFQLLYEHNKYDLQTYWASIEANSKLDRVDAYRPVIENPQRVKLWVLHYLAITFQVSGRLKEAMTLHKEHEKICRQMGDLDGLHWSLGNQAIICVIQGTIDEAEELLKEQEHICRELGNMDGLQSSLYIQGTIHLFQGRPDEAMKLHKEQERICRQERNLDGLILSLGAQGGIQFTHGRLDEAMALYKEEERICRQLGNLVGISDSLVNQANILLNQGRLDEAMGLYKEGERIYRQVGNLVGISDSLANQAIILKHWGKLEEAMELHKETEHIYRQLGNLDGLARSIGNQANIYYANSNNDEALVLEKEAVSIWRQLGNPKELESSLSNLAKTYYTQGCLDKAMDLNKEAELLCRQMENLDGLQTSLHNQGRIQYDQGNLDIALGLFKEEEHICRQLENLEGLHFSLVFQALILHHQGQLDKAIELYKNAELICRQLGKLDWLQASLKVQALILKKWGKIEEEMELHKEEERIFQKLGNLDGLQISLGTQGNILKDWGKLDEAMEKYKEQERICRQMENLDGLQTSLHNQGRIQYDQGNLDIALGLFKEEEHICRQLENQNSLQISLGNQLEIHYNQGRLDNALELLKEQEHICRELGDLDCIQRSIGNQGLILETWGELDEAMKLLKEQEHICRQLGNNLSLCISFVNQGEVYEKLGDREKQLESVSEALTIARTNGLTTMASVIEGVLDQINESRSL